MVPDFSNFDDKASSSFFWSISIQEVNQQINRAHIEDSLIRRGVSLVIGCPLPKAILQKITQIQNEFQSILNLSSPDIKINYRINLDALHLTVYGLVKFKDYLEGRSWPISDEIITELKRIFYEFPNLSLTLQGLGF